MSLKYNERKWKEKLHEIIYEADTPAGKLFDIILLIVILLSVVLVMLESIGSIESKYTYDPVLDKYISVGHQRVV